ncbi:hypothetical protein E0Z10_g5656 [Xylaria hypoxylon]|uniref:VWFA domain-containing protein n=1 Tax=Xylaria hypoxylon TaxID=37992 RepID=A0A4Z0YST4_9PEZI|nr:hypothetical protein E0Z10_g5656 [Xylaria hypoxylon]
MTLAIPTYIVNRYGQRPADLEGLNLDTKPDDISLRIEILESENIQSIKSTSHEILVVRGTDIGQALKWDHIGKGPNDAEHETAIVTTKEATSWVETDFVLSIDTACSKGSGGAEAWLEMHPSFENHAAMMVTLPPRLLLSQNGISKDGEILFVADRSGSMGDKIVNLRSAMRFFLKGIPVGRTFNIWCFGSKCEHLWAKSQTYGQESLRVALDYVNRKFHADMGGTEILAVIQAIVAARNPSLPCDVVILTDGEVWRLDETLSLVRNAHESSNGAIRFFSLGLGAHISHALVEGIAKRGGGYSEVIPQADKGGWGERVIAMLKAALSSHTCFLRLELGGLKAMTSPANLESVSLFQAHKIFLLLEQGTTSERGTIALTLVSDKKLTPISIIRAEKMATIIHSLAARAILNDLEQRVLSNTTYLLGDLSKTDGKVQDTLQLAESIACKYSLPSKWTSLFLENEVQEGEGDSGTTNKILTFRVEDGYLQNSRGMTPSHWATAQMCGSTPERSPESYRLPPKQASIGTFCSSSSNMDFALPSQTLGDPDYEWHATPLDNTDVEEEFVSFILSHQAFDGSIASGVLNELPETARDIIGFLKDLLGKKTNLKGPVLDLVANTALIVELLERDYKDCEGLWVMIREKALEYIHLQVLQSDLKDELLEYSRQNLEKLDGLIRLKRRAASTNATSSNATRKSRKKRLDANTEGEDQVDPDRVLVHIAPVG